MSDESESDEWLNLGVPMNLVRKDSKDGGSSTPPFFDIKLRRFPHSVSDLESLRKYDTKPGSRDVQKLSVEKLRQYSDMINKDIEAGYIEIRKSEERVFKAAAPRMRRTRENVLNKIITWSFACIICRLTEFDNMYEYLSHLNGSRHKSERRARENSYSLLQMVADEQRLQEENACKKRKAECDDDSDTVHQERSESNTRAHVQVNRTQPAWTRQDNLNDRPHKFTRRKRYFEYDLSSLEITAHSQRDGLRLHDQTDSEPGRNLQTSPRTKNASSEMDRCETEGGRLGNLRDETYVSERASDSKNPSKSAHAERVSSHPTMTPSTKLNWTWIMEKPADHIEWPDFKDIPESTWKSEKEPRLPPTGKEIRRREKHRVIEKISKDSSVSIPEGLKHFSSAKDKREFCDARFTELRKLKLFKKEVMDDPNYVIREGATSSNMDTNDYLYRPYEDETMFNAVVARRVASRNAEGLPTETPLRTDRKTNHDRRHEEPILNVLAKHLWLVLPDEGKAYFKLQSKLVDKLRNAYRHRSIEKKGRRSHRSRSLPPSVERIQVKPFGSVRNKIEGFDSDLDIYVLLVQREGELVDKSVLKDFQERVSMLLSNEMEKEKHAAGEPVTKPRDDYILISESTFPSLTEPGKEITRSSFIQIHEVIQIDITFHPGTCHKELENMNLFAEKVRSMEERFPEIMNAIEVSRVLLTRWNCYGGSAGGMTNLCLLHAALRLAEVFKDEPNLYRLKKFVGPANPDVESLASVDSKNWKVSRATEALLWMIFHCFAKLLVSPAGSTAEPNDLMKDVFKLTEMPNPRAIPEHVQIKAVIESVDEPGVNLFNCHKTKLKHIFYEITRALLIMDHTCEGDNYNPSLEVLACSNLVKAPHERRQFPHQKNKSERDYNYRYREMKDRGMFYPTFFWKESWNNHGRRLFTEEFVAAVETFKPVCEGPLKSTAQSCQK